MNDVQQERRTWWGGRRRVEEDRALTKGTVPAPMLTSGTGGQPVTPSNAMAVADVFACVRCLSDAAASIPLVPYRRTAQGRTRADGALAQLLTRPAPATTQANLIGQAVAHLNLFGNAWLAKFRGSDGRVEQLGLLHPDRVTPELRSGVPVYTVQDGRGGRSEHGVEDIIHVRALSTDGLLGMSPVRQCRVAIGLGQSLAEHASVFFENGARPTGILKVPSSGQEALEHISAAWSQRQAGTRNAHKIAVVSGEVEFTPITGPLDDLQFVEQRHLSTAEIARIFRIPPYMLGASDGNSMTYSNTEQQALNFVTWALRPWLTLIEQAISEDDDLCPGNLYCEFLLDALLRSDSKTRSEIYTAALNPQTGHMSRAEVRRLENLPPETEPDPPEIA